MRENATRLPEHASINEPELTPMGHLSALLMDVRSIRALSDGVVDEKLTISAIKHASAIIGSNIFDKLKVRNEIERLRKDIQVNKLIPEAIRFLALSNTVAGDAAKKGKGFIFRLRVNRRIRINSRVLGFKNK